VPKFLGAIPDNPFICGPICYRRTKAGYSLYAVGPTGKHHDGKLGSWPEVEAGTADMGVDVDDAQPRCGGPGRIGAIVSKLRNSIEAATSRFTR
jgi:hypothetical protein